MFDKRLKFVGNVLEISLDIFGTASVFEKGHKYVANDFNILNMT